MTPVDVYKWMSKREGSPELGQMQKKTCKSWKVRMSKVSDLNHTRQDHDREEWSDIEGPACRAGPLEDETKEWKWMSRCIAPFTTK